MDEKTNEEIKKFAEQVSSVLKDNFIGFYIFGSLAMGNWDTVTSDIDFLVIIKTPVVEQEMQELKVLHEKLLSSDIGYKLEGEYVDLKMLQKNYLSSHCAGISNGNFYSGPCNLSADNIVCLIEYGLVIIGKPINELGLHVTKEELREAVLGMLKEDAVKIDGATDFKSLYHLLINILRSIYTLQTNQLPSKLSAIEHNKDLLGEKFYGEIKLYIEHKIFEFPISKEKLKMLVKFGFQLKNN